MSTPHGQSVSDIFTGVSSSAAGGRRATEKGITRTSVPAFVAGEELADLADADPRVVVMTADLATASRLIDFRPRHPDRFIDMGIAEQIRTDCAYPGMPVRILAHHSGMSLGFYGTSHHALEDLSALRSVADLTVACAADSNQLRAMLRASLDVPGAIYLRLGRGRDPDVYPEVPADFAFGRAATLRDGGDVTVIATGSEVHPALGAADLLTREGLSVRVIDMHTISPLDTDAVEAAARETGAVLTVEEHNITGGLGGAVAEVLAERRLAVPFRRHGVPDDYALIGPPAALYAHYRLDAAGIAAEVRDLRATAGVLPHHEPERT
jgi:transketolase